MALAQRNVTVHSEPYKTSYERSYFYENVIYNPFVYSRVKRKPQDYRKIEDPLEIEKSESVNKAAYVTKYSDKRGSDSDRYPRLVFRDSLKSLDEKYTKHPPGRLGIGPSTSSLAYARREKLFEQQKWQRPIGATGLSIPPHTKEGFSSLRLNEFGYTKYLDPYVSSSRSSHRAFTTDEQNGIAKKDVVTFYDLADLPKNRGFGPKRLGPFGSYFRRDWTIPSRVFAKLTASVPFFGKTSTYAAATYDYYVPTNLMYHEEAISVPAISKAIEDPSYCTEQCHVGTGWPIRASLNIGTVPGTR